MKRILPEETQYYRLLESKDFSHSMRSAIAFTLTPSLDGGETVIYYGESWIDPTYSVHKPQYVYVLVNPSIPGICKIGFTTTTVYERVKQINVATGVILPWYPVFIYKCPNGYLLEQDIHAHLTAIRVNPKREGFEITTTDAILIIEKLGKRYENFKSKTD